MTAISAAMKKGAPVAFQQVLDSANRSEWNQFRDSFEGAAANVLPLVTLGLSPLANKAWSKDAQAGIDPGMQMVLGGAGAIGGSIYLTAPAPANSTPVDLGTTVTSNGGVESTANAMSPLEVPVTPPVPTVTYTVPGNMASTMTPLQVAEEVGAGLTTAKQVGALVEKPKQPAAPVTVAAPAPKQISTAEAGFGLGGLLLLLFFL
jgi:hypothetical protein